ncbi:MAG: sensor histidine kinase [Clostridia bacterium]|nr:sensor histidine kinase [Clostridia bacterium]
MKKIKKNHKLLIEISFVLIPVFVALIIGVSLIMYNSTVDGFLEAQDASMEVSLTKSHDTIEGLLYDNDDFRKWCFDQWEKIDKLQPKQHSSDEYTEYYDYLHNYDGFGGTVEFAEQMPSDLKELYIDNLYMMLCDYMKSETVENKYDYMFVLYVDDDNFGKILCDYDPKIEGRTPYDHYDIDKSKHPAIEKILKDNSNKISFERSEDFPGEGNYYIAYKPIKFDGKVRAVMGIVYNWEDLRTTMSNSMLKARLLGIGGISLAMVILLIVLYRRSIKPLTKIQGIVCDYTKNKNSAEALERTAEITERNEFGLLSDDISEMVKEIDHYTEENIRIAGEKERAEKELYEAQVSVMVSQIQPHFMYNALSSIAMLCTVDPETAQEATVEFADYLRGNMDSLKQKAPVPFTAELEHLKKYLYIEKLRFGKKLNVEYDIQATEFVVPQLSIQPLVENAVKHGVGMKKKGGTVTIATRDAGEAFEVIIKDDGVGFDTSAPRKEDGRSHVGIENTRKRLKDMCGADVITTSVIGEGTTVKVVLPKEVQNNENALR